MTMPPAMPNEPSRRAKPADTAGLTAQEPLTPADTAREAAISKRAGDMPESFCRP